MRNAANPEGWQPELLEMGEVVHVDTSSGQPFFAKDVVREARGREIGLLADHGMYDLVAQGAARGKLVRAKWLDDWERHTG